MVRAKAGGEPFDRCDGATDGGERRCGGGGSEKISAALTHQMMLRCDSYGRNR